MKILAIRGHNLASLAGRFDIPLAEGALGDAVKAYRQALRLNPGSFRARANLASTLTTLGELDAAARQLSGARELFPGHPRLREMEERLRRRHAAERPR